jgi:DNA polymerase-3 subunit gamma/tau
MSEYQVIARKWRPQTFSDVVGQEHVGKTLRNEIIQGRTAHAYLFVGPRGIGKTTSARIFAKALNCTAPEAGEPCCKCESCRAIMNGNSIDVIEIDAASQNSVNNIRELRDEAMFAPTSSKYKIYIIDEVHMLSAGAWNALLKTVEEPPPHVKFLFATTEAHKVLPTIVSRCQRFDLRRIPTRLISDRLRKIADTEKVNISQAAIEAIARAADGGMRDGQSLLDQMISFFSASGDTEISEDQVLSLFGLTAISEMENLIGAIISNDKAAAILNIHNLSLQGRNLETLFEELLNFLRNIQLCQILPEPEKILESGEESIELYRRLGSQTNQGVIQRLLETLSSVGNVLHNALNKQVFLETVILKAMRIAHSPKIEDLIARLNQIRNSEDLAILEQAPPAVAIETNYATLPVVPKPAPEVAPTAEENKPEPVPAPIVEENKEPEPEVEKVEIQEEEQVNPVQSSTIEEAQPVIEEETPELEAIEELAAEDEKITESETIEDYPQDLPDVETYEDEDDDNDLEDYQDNYSEPEYIPQTELVKAQAVEARFSPDKLWHLLIEDINDQIKDPILRGFMQEGKPEKLSGTVLTVCFDEEYEQEHAEKVKKSISFLNKRLDYITGVKGCELRVEMRSEIANIHNHHRENTPDMDELRAKVVKNELVQTVMDLFDGEIVDIHG